MTSLQTEPIVRAIREHQQQNSIEWFHRELVQELHTWAERFNQDFALDLPTPVIAIARLRITTFGKYCLGRSDIGARTTTYFNELWLPPRRSKSDMIGTLFHERLHAYEEYHLGRKVGGWYHTKAWREKLASIGIIADDHGHHLQVLPQFIAYLQRYGVTDGVMDAETANTVFEPPRRGRQMPKWICGCPSGNPARAVYLNAHCLSCNQPYHKVST